MRPHPSFEDVAPRLAAARGHWRNRGDPERETPPAGVVFEFPGPGQESVWSYPRPPRVEDVPERVRVVFGGRTIADSTRARRVIETAGAPTIYLPPDDVTAGVLRDAGRWSMCEWKGFATTYDVVVDGRTAHGGAWSYREPFGDLGAGYEQIKDYVAFMPGKMDACYLGDDPVRPQPGGFYGGWVTDRITGPIKGRPGSESW